MKLINYLLAAIAAVTAATSAQAAAWDLRMVQYDASNRSREVVIAPAANSLLGFDENKRIVNVTAGANITISGNQISASGAGNVAKGSPFADGQLLYISNATTGEVTGIAGATFTPGNNTIGFNGTISSTGFAPTSITGATGPLQVWIGNNVTGNFTKGNLVEGNGITLTKGANDITVAAAATGTNTGDQNIIFSVAVSGQDTVTANSTTTELTLAATGGLAVTTNNTTKTVTIDGSGISAGATPDGHSILLETANLGSLASGFFISGNFGTAADVLGNYTVVTKSLGTVATPTASPTPGAIPDGTTITFSSTTPSLTNFRSTTNGTDPDYTIGTAGNSVVLSGNTTYEVVANKQGWVTSAVASFAYTVDPVPTHSGAWTIAADGDTHTLVFSEAITFGAGGSGGFVANMSGGAVNLTYSSGSGSTSIVFTGNRTVASSETQTGDNGEYTQPGNGAEDSAGQDVVTFTGHTITNNSEAGGGGSPALIASVATGGTANGVTSSSIDTTGANLLVASVSWYPAGGADVTTTELTDSKGNTWTQLNLAGTISGTNTANRLFYCYGGTVGASHTFTVSQTGSYPAISVLAFSNASTAPFDQQAQNESSGVTTLQPGSITATQANSILVASVAFSTAGTISIDGSFTMQAQANYSGGNSMGGGIAYRIDTSASATNPTFTNSGSSGHMSASIASFDY